MNKADNSIGNWAVALNFFIRKDMQIANENVIHLYTPLYGLAKIRSGLDKQNSHLLLVQLKLIWPLWETIRQYLLNICVSCDSAILLLGIKLSS